MRLARGPRPVRLAPKPAGPAAWSSRPRPLVCRAFTGIQATGARGSQTAHAWGSRRLAGRGQWALAAALSPRPGPWHRQDNGRLGERLSY